MVAYWFLTTPKNLPPGPTGLPILGYLPFLGKRPPETFNYLGKKYGSVYRLYLGSRLVIVLNDYNAIREAFVKQAEVFSGRPEELAAGIPKKYLKTFITTDGDFWKEHRRFTISLLRDCGVGKLSIESRMMEEINHFLEKVKEFKGEPADLKDLLSTSIANNICIMALGKRFEYGNPTFLKIKHSIDEALLVTSIVSAVNFFPWLKFIPRLQHLIARLDLEKLVITINTFLKKIVEEHKRNYVPGQRDHYVNAYFTEQQQRLELNKSTEDFDELALINNMRILMLAGTETTSSTLLWGILYMITHPEIQKKVQDELDRVIGPDRTPSWNDKLRTPYTEATIYEIQRKANLVPLNLPHRNKEECQVAGYTIPQSTFILSNLGNVLDDPKLWGDPENFRPERFLTSQGEVQKPEYFIPFSTGKRECAGEILARMELYLYFTTMLQKFTFKIPNGHKPNMEGFYGTAHIPSTFMTCAISRHD